MAKRQQDPEFLRFAARGAQARIQEIEEEIARLRRLFPTLRGGRTAAVSTDGQDAPAPPQKKRRHMSDAAREAARERMRLYWEKKRGQSAGAVSAAADSDADSTGATAATDTAGDQGSTPGRKRSARAQKKGPAPRRGAKAPKKR